MTSLSTKRKLTILNKEKQFPKSKIDTVNKLKQKFTIEILSKKYLRIVIYLK